MQCCEPVAATTLHVSLDVHRSIFRAVLTDPETHAPTSVDVIRQFLQIQPRHEHLELFPVTPSAPPHVQRSGESLPSVAVVEDVDENRVPSAPIANSAVASPVTTTRPVSDSDLIMPVASAPPATLQSSSQNPRPLNQLVVEDMTQSTEVSFFARRLDNIPPTPDSSSHMVTAGPNLSGETFVTQRTEVELAPVSVSAPVEVASNSTPTEAESWCSQCSPAWMTASVPSFTDEEASINHQLSSSLVMRVHLQRFYQSPLLDSLFGRTWFNALICVLCVMLWVFVILGVGNTVMGLVGIFVLLIPLSALFLSRIESSLLLPHSLLSFDAMWLIGWFITLNVAAWVEEYYRYQNLVGQGSTLTPVQFGLQVALGSSGLVALFVLCILQDAFPRAPHWFKIFCIFMLLCSAAYQWIVIRVISPHSQILLPICFPSTKICTNSVRLRLDAWFCISAYFLRLFVVLLVYPEHRFLFIKSHVRLSVRTEFLDPSNIDSEHTLTSADPVVPVWNTVSTSPQRRVAAIAPRVAFQDPAQPAPPASEVVPVDVDALPVVDAGCLLLRSNMAAELIQQRFRHDPALSMCHRWNLFTWFWRMSSQVQMSQFVLWVIFLCVAAITVTSSPYRTYPMSFILIIISYTICVLSIFLILSIYDWPVVRYLLGTFEYCFVMFLSLALFGLELSQALLDNRATVLYFAASHSRFEVLSTSIIRCMCVIIITGTMASIDALMAAPRFKFATVFGWLIFAVIRITAESGIIVSLPPYVTEHTLCLQTECFQTLSLRLQIYLTLCVFAIKYLVLLWLYPQTLAVVRASVTYKDEAAELHDRAEQLRRHIEELEAESPGQLQQIMQNMAQMAQLPVQSSVSLPQQPLQ